MKQAILMQAMLLGLAATIAAAQGARAAETPAKIENGVWVAPSGMTLYTFDKDVAGSGKSACYGGCATMWPPLVSGAAATISGDFSVITREDGTKQITHKGRPLYLYAADQKPGDMSGDNSGGVWHVSRPAAAESAVAPSKPYSAGSYSYGY